MAAIIVARSKGIVRDGSSFSESVSTTDPTAEYWSASKARRICSFTIVCAWSPPFLVDCLRGFLLFLLLSSIKVVLELVCMTGQGETIHDDNDDDDNNNNDNRFYQF